MGVAVAAAACRGGFTPLGDAGGDARDAAGTVDTPDAGLPAVLRTGCAFYLAMDEATWTGAPDEVADACSTHPGTAFDGAAIIADPVRGRVGHFVGNSSCVVIPDAPALRATTAVSMSAWLRPVGVSANGMGVISKRVDYTIDSEYGVMVWADNYGAGTTNLAYVDIDTENDRAPDPDVVYADGVWHQLTVVYDGTRPASTRVIYYVDGAFSYAMTETSSTIAPTASHPDVSVGCLPLSARAQGFTGDLDDVVVWTRALSAAEVASWYAATKR